MSVLRALVKQVAGADSAGLLGPGGHWWTGAVTLRYCESVADVSSGGLRSYVPTLWINCRIIEHWAKLLNSQNRILLKSPGSRIFMFRPHIQDESRKCLSGGATTIRITPKKGGVIKYLRSSLGGDATSDVMESN